MVEYFCFALINNNNSMNNEQHEHFKIFSIYSHHLLTNFCIPFKQQIRKVTVGQDQSYKTSCLLNILLILLTKNKKQKNNTKYI